MTQSAEGETMVSDEDHGSFEVPTEGDFDQKIATEAVWEPQHEPRQTPQFGGVGTGETSPGTPKSPKTSPEAEPAPALTPIPVPATETPLLKDAESDTVTTRTPRVLYGTRRQDRPAQMTWLIRELYGKAREALRVRTRRRLDRIMAHVAERGSITNDDVEKLLHVSDRTATRYLGELMRTGSLTVNGKQGKVLRYMKRVGWARRLVGHIGITSLHVSAQCATSDTMGAWSYSLA